VLLARTAVKEPKVPPVKLTQPIECKVPFKAVMSRNVTVSVRDPHSVELCVSLQPPHLSVVSQYLVVSWHVSR
jgi:hypothetical protein